MKYSVFILLFAVSCSSSTHEMTDSSHNCKVEFNIRKIGLNELDLKARKLYDKLITGESLNEQEDIELIMMMNTRLWSKLDSTELQLNESLIIDSLSEVFEKSYYSELKKKYTICAKSSSVIFENIAIAYNGNPSICSRFELSDDRNEKESLIKHDRINDEPMKDIRLK